MTKTATGAARWEDSIEQAKAEIFGPDSLSAPAPLVNLARNQLGPIITEMERQLSEKKVDDTWSIHLFHVKHRYVDAAVGVLEESLSSTFFSKACERFVKRYERLEKEKDFKALSPA